MDLYTVLEITHEATPEEIRAAYRRLAKLYHPDVSQLRDAQQRFVRITEAYEVLGNPTRRLRYDLTRHSPHPRTAPPREEARYERAVHRYQRDARARAEKFGRMKYAEFDTQYFDTVFGYVAPKMLGCLGIMVLYLILVVLLILLSQAYPGFGGVAAFLVFTMFPVGVWLSTQFDAWHNRRQREKRTGMR